MSRITDDEIEKVANQLSTIAERIWESADCDPTPMNDEECRGAKVLRGKLTSIAFALRARASGMELTSFDDAIGRLDEDQLAAIQALVDTGVRSGGAEP
jgi:hypothetical protein